jgi:hypothetical protein
VKVQLQIFFTIFFVLFTVIETSMNTPNSHNFNKPQSLQCITAVYQKSAAQATDTKVLYPFRSIIWHLFEFKPTTMIGQHALYILQPWLTSIISIYHITNTVIQMWSELTWFMWSDFVSNLREVTWVMVKFLGTKVPCTLGWPYTEGTWLYCDYVIWCVSCTVVVLTCFVMWGCVYLCL